MSIFDPKYRLNHISAQVAKKLFHISKAIRNIEREKGKLENLTPTQVDSLIFLNYIRPDIATVSALARYLGCKPSTVTGIVDALEKKGLVRRNKISGEDRRQVFLALTEKGLTVVKAVECLGKELEEIITSRITPEEQRLLDELLGRITATMKDKGYVFISEVCKTCDFLIFNRDPSSDRPHYCSCLNIFLNNMEIYEECPEYKEATG